MKELANGFSIVQADVRLRQPRGDRKALRLSRLVNMSESGPHLLDDFIRRSPYRSGLDAKLNSLPEAVQAAALLLRSMSPEGAREGLIATGTPPLIAETAVYEARSRHAP